MPSDCIFCQIISGSLPSTKLYEDDYVLSFLDIEPINPGHALVIPKVHAAYFTDLSVEYVPHLLTVAQKVLAAIERSSLRCEGANLILNNKPAAGQEVLHTHLHIVPRFSGDNCRPGLIRPAQLSDSKIDIKQIAKSIQKQL